MGNMTVAVTDRTTFGMPTPNAESVLMTITGNQQRVFVAVIKKMLRESDFILLLWLDMLPMA